MIFPFPSSPHWAPKTLSEGMGSGSCAGARSLGWILEDGASRLVDS